MFGECHAHFTLKKNFSRFRKSVRALQPLQKNYIFRPYSTYHILFCGSQKSLTRLLIITLTSSFTFPVSSFPLLGVSLSVTFGGVQILQFPPSIKKVTLNTYSYIHANPRETKGGKGSRVFHPPPTPENCFSEGRKMVHSFAFWI